jgi:hypothetical protein
MILFTEHPSLPNPSAETHDHESDAKDRLNYEPLPDACNDQSKSPTDEGKSVIGTQNDHFTSSPEHTTSPSPEPRYPIPRHVLLLSMPSRQWQYHHQDLEEEVVHGFNKEER